MTVTSNLWPELGLEFTFESQSEFDESLKALGYPAGGRSDLRLKIFINGASDKYATLYDSGSTLLGTLTKDEWHTRNTVLPKARFIRSDLKLSIIAEYFPERPRSTRETSTALG